MIINARSSSAGLCHNSVVHETPELQAAFKSQSPYIARWRVVRTEWENKPGTDYASQCGCQRRALVPTYTRPRSCSLVSLIQLSVDRSAHL